MAARLKGVILSVEDVIVNKGTINKKVFEQADLLMKFFRIRGIIPVLLANSNWTVTTEKERTKKDLFDVLKRHYPDLKIFSRHFDKKIPPKPRAEATQYVCNMMGWKKNETLYIGSTENDMRTAVNGNLLFLCGTWYNDNINYGFKFSEQKQMARFIDTLCLREHFWSHEIHEDNIQFYALAPFSTMRPDYARYSDDAKRAAKHGLGHPDFWLSALVTSLYFTGIHEKIDFIASYPGHKAGVGNDKMNNDLMTFAKCFRKGYLHNLIERHTTALKSQTSRNQGIQLNHLNQLNTIKLNRLPTKNYSSVYKCNPLKRGKTVLLVDDICTKGFSLESGRKYIEQTNAKVIMVTWLKTINSDICALENLGEFDPYVPNKFTKANTARFYGYKAYLIDTHASEELGDHLHEFINWDWPKEII